MSKSKKQYRPAAPTRGPATPAASTLPAVQIAPRAEPTPEQLERVGMAELEVADLVAEHGAPTSEEVVEPIGPTLEETLKRVEQVIRTAGGVSKDARAAETRAKAARDALQSDQYEQTQRTVRLDVREKALVKREREVVAQEALLAERSAQVVARELAADEGFRAEKARMLEPVASKVAELQAERDRLDTEIAARRAEAQTEARAAAEERAAQWAAEDEQRTSAAAAARRALDDADSMERETALAKLREDLRLERARREAEVKSELEVLGAALDARETEVKAREDAHAVSARTLRAAQRDLEAGQGMLAEDRAALDRQVARLVSERTEALRHDRDSLKTQLEAARGQRDGYFNELESRRELDRRFGERTPEQILADLAALERDRDTLAQQLRARPDAGAAEQLAKLERQHSAWLAERALLQGDLAKATAELSTRRLAALELETLKKEKEALEVYKKLLDGAVDELRTRVDELTRQEDHRNPLIALSSLDEDEGLQALVRTVGPLRTATPTLRDFAVDLRHRIAKGVDGRTLYYAERDVRAFLGGLAMTRLMLLQGISGTGKTSLPKAFVTAVDGGIEIVEVQAGWRDRQDLVGYYNAFHRHYYATNFLQALYRAGTPAYKDRLFLMVLDEINLSRPEQFFADFLSALEQEPAARRLTLVNDPLTQAPRLMVEGRHLPIPPNVWFVGTANHDESTTEFADKTYDRAHVMEMPRKTEAAQFEVVDRGHRQPVSYEALQACFTKAMADRAKDVGAATTWLRKAPFANDLAERFRVGWGNRLEQQLGTYLPVVVEAGGSVGEAMDHLLVTKVFRKLKDRHDVRATGLEDLRKQLKSAWVDLDKANPPERCLALIDHEIAAKKGEEMV